jgi:hypothetical protein
MNALVTNRKLQNPKAIEGSQKKIMDLRGEEKISIEVWGVKMDFRSNLKQ